MIPIDATIREEISQSIPLIVIVGASAVGKTEIAIRVAKNANGEIVSADSALIYRGMDIGSAKPSIQERQSVPHHMIDVANPDEKWSLSEYQCRANQAIRDIYHRGRLPFLVGGTGQYIRAMVQSWQVPEVAPDEQMRSVLDGLLHEIGAMEFHRRLAQLDSVAASRIDYRNTRRTIRAWEVILKTGRCFSDQRKSGIPVFKVLQIGLSRPRDELYCRVDLRIENMIVGGIIEEVRGLLSSGYSPNIPAFSAIGYKETIDYLAGKTSFEEMIALIKKRTRVLIRHQSNWFKPDDPLIHWFDVNTDTVEKILDLIADWIKGNPYQLNLV